MVEFAFKSMGSIIFQSALNLKCLFFVLTTIKQPRKLTETPVSRSKTQTASYSYYVQAYPTLNRCRRSFKTSFCSCTYQVASRLNQNRNL